MRFLFIFIKSERRAEKGVVKDDPDQHDHDLPTQINYQRILAGKGKRDVPDAVKRSEKALLFVVEYPCEPCAEVEECDKRE